MTVRIYKLIHVNSMQHSAHASQFRSSWRQFAAAMSSGAGKTSKVSLHSVRAAASGLPRARACPWVAQWFTVPQLVVKALQLVYNMLRPQCRY